MNHKDVGLTQSKDVVGLAASSAGATAAEVGTKVLIATTVVVVTSGDGIGEVAGGWVGETAGVRRPAEAGVEVQLGPVLLLVVDLAVGLKHHGAALVAVEVGQGEVRAGLEEAAGGECGTGQGNDSHSGDGRGLHVDCLLLMR